jgi:hypothetical protein
MNTIAIMQPTFFPWLGYFELVNKVDKFVFLDDVEISKQSWQTRNFFCSNNQCYWKSIPIKGSSKNMINEAEISRQDLFFKKFLKFIEQNFKNYKFDEIHRLIHQINYQYEEINLADFNIKFLEWALKLFNIRTAVYRSSQIEGSNGLIKTREEKIINIVKKLSCDRYIAAMGSKDYMEKFGLGNYPFEVEFFDYPNSKKISIFYDGYGFENVLELINRLGISKIQEEVFLRV